MMLVGDFADLVKRVAAQAAFDKAVGLLDSCDGIEVVDSTLESEEDMTLDDLRHVRRWDNFDDVSLPGRPEAPS